MRYQRIHTNIWHDEKFITLSEPAKHLFIYLLSSPHSNAIGIYVIPKLYICADLKWQSKQLGKPLQELLQQRLIKYDDEVNLLIITNQLKYNPIENPNQTKNACKLIEQLPKSSIFSDTWELFDKPFHKPLRELLHKQFSKQFSKPETETETETEAETEEENTLAQKSSESDSLFEQFWRAYPKKRSKAQAKKAFNKLKVKNGLLQEILTAVENASQSIDWTKDNGKFIPYPATWLNAGGWEDEYINNIRNIHSERTLRNFQAAQEFINQGE